MCSSDLTAINFHGTLSAESGWSRAWNDTTLRFVSLAALAFTASGLLNAVFGFRVYNALVRFTSFPAGQEQLLAYVEAARRAEKVTFLGRLGTYRYLDMDVTIKEALETADAFLRARREGTRMPSLTVEPL